MFCRLIVSMIALCLVSHALVAQDYQPAIESASDEGKLAMEGFQIPEGMQVHLWAAEPNLANPVAFCIDEKGRVYVCETFRQQKGVEDNRGHMNWLERDLSLTSVEERLEMFKEFLGEGVADYAKEHDRIRLLVDTDNDGTADQATVFADGFNDILDGTGAGVLAIDGDVYYTCIPKLWKLKDTDGDGVSNQKEAMFHGFGIRVAFRGHDMHGLIVGPDGRLYFSIGDRGFNVVTKEEQPLFKPDTGAVFRCELDGSHLEVVAYGLRNPQELAFDNYGNLFTGDNNSDSGDQARWVQVVEGGDTGWRMYYQYLSDRGPWNRERIWYPKDADELTTEVQPAYTLPPISHLGDGPSGLVYYPGVGLSEQYNNHFFMADFRGSAGQSGIRSFSIKPKGASYELINDQWFLKAILATDVDFGYDGKMYVSDWVDGWNGTSKGRIYAFTDEKHQYPPASVHSDELMKSGLSKVQRLELSGYMSHPDRRIRQATQFELVKRNEQQLLEQIAKARTGLLPRIHAIWGLGQLLRNGNKDVASKLLALLNDNDAEIRTQVIRMLGDAAHADAFDGLVDRIQHGTPREQYMASVAIGKLHREEAVPALIALLKSNADNDPVVRHAATMGLIGSTTESGLKAYFDDEADAVRMGVVLALRRMESPQIAHFLQDKNAKIVTEAARAIHDLPIIDALPALAHLTPQSEMSDALLRRIVNANFRLGQPENAEVVALIVGSDTYEMHLRKEAVEELLMWDQPPVLDRVINQYRPLEPRSLDTAQDAVAKHIREILALPIEVKQSAVKLAAKYLVSEVAEEILLTLNTLENAPSLRGEALKALAAINYKGIDGILLSAMEDNDGQLRAIALGLLAEKSPEKAIPGLSKAIVDGTRYERQSAVAVLDSIQLKAADEVLLSAMDRYLAGELPPEIRLDVIEVAEKRQSEEFGKKLAAILETRDLNNPLSVFQDVLEGGDMERGKELFYGNAAASCRRCHKVNGEGSDVGPDLSGVAKDKPRDYLLESIVNPNAKIAKGFETVVFAMDTGKIVSGVIKSEDEETYTLVKPMGEKVIVVKDQIDDRAIGKSGMPDDITKQLKKSELRDIVEYLSTLKVPAEAAAHGKTEE